MLRLYIFLLTITSLINFVSTTVQCKQQNITVQCSSNRSVPLTSYSIGTWFCWKQGTPLNASQIIHLTISGYTYDHTYWAFSYQPSNYSYVNYIIENSHGNIAVLNFDRIGLGLSDKPPGSFITIDVHANEVYQLTEKLSTGTFHGVSFSKIILVGHSLGTIIALAVASHSSYNTYTSGVIATAFLHLPNLVGYIGNAASSYEA